MKKKWIFLTVCLMALMGLVGCSGNKTQETGEKTQAAVATEAPVSAEKTVRDTLRTTQTAIPDTCDPAKGSGENDDLIFVNIYETLVYPNATTGDAEPLLATSWTSDNDGLKWTFTLRDDVKFSDGTPMTANDVKYSVDRLIAIGEGFSYIFKDVIASVDVVDDTTVVFNLKKSFGPFISSLIKLRIVNSTLLKANQLDGNYGENGDYGTTYLLNHSAGSGPYYISTFNVNDSVYLTENSNYWGAINDKAPKSVEITGLLDAATSKMLLNSGEVDLLHGRQVSTTLKSLLTNPEFATTSIAETGMNYFMMNTKKAPTDDLHIRKAISYACDRNAMSAIYGGMELSDSPIPSSFWGATDDVTTYPYSEEDAKKEIALSSYANNLADYPVEIAYIQGNGDTGKLAMLLGSELEAVGFTVKISEVPWVLFCDNAATVETSPSITNANSNASYPEAGSLLEVKFSSMTAGTFNQNEWILDDKLDAMIADSLATVDNDARLAKYAEIQKYLTTDVVPTINTFVGAVKPIWNTSVFSWPAGEGSVHVLEEYNYYYADFMMK